MVYRHQGSIQAPGSAAVAYEAAHKGASSVQHPAGTAMRCFIHCGFKHLFRAATRRSSTFVSPPGPAEEYCCAVYAPAYRQWARHALALAAAFISMPAFSPRLWPQAVEKLVLSKLLVEGSQRRIFSVEKHVGMVGGSGGCGHCQGSVQACLPSAQPCHGMVSGPQAMQSRLVLPCAACCTSEPPSKQRPRHLSSLCAVRVRLAARWAHAGEQSTR